MAKLTPKQQKSQDKARSLVNKNAQRAAVQKQKLAQKVAQQKKNNPGLVPYGQHEKADWRHSTNDQAVTYNRHTPQQQQVLNNLMQYLQPGVANLALPGNDKLSFEPIRQNALNDFNQKIVPSIAERFQSLGGRDSSGGALSSPALYQQLLGGSNQLQSQLAALEAQYGLQKNQAESSNLFNLLGAGLNPQFDIGTITGQNSGLRNSWNAVKGAVPGAIAGGITGGPAGAAYGGLTGLGLGQVSDALQQRYQNQIGQGNGNSAGFTAQNSPSGFDMQGNHSFNNSQQTLNSLIQGYQNNQF